MVKLEKEAVLAKERSKMKEQIVAELKHDQILIENKRIIEVYHPTIVITFMV